jgi:Fe-S oxidoreductase
MEEHWRDEGMSRKYLEILKARGAFQCVECGKCVAMCPMAETSPGFSRVKSPRGVVQQALRGMDDMPGVESCLQCRSCSQTCPAGVDVAGLIADLHRLQARAQLSLCSSCGAPLLPADAGRYLEGAVNAGFEGEIVYASLCPACRRRAYIRNNS